MKLQYLGIIILLSIQLHGQGVVSTFADANGVYGYFGDEDFLFPHSLLIGDDFIQSIGGPTLTSPTILHINPDDGSVLFGPAITFPLFETPPMVRIASRSNSQIALGFGGHGRVSTDDSYVLYLNHNNGGAQGAESFQVRDGTGNFANAALVVYENGNGVFNGIVTATDHINSSDRRYKKNITPLSNSLSNLSLIKGVRYDWNQEKWPNRSFNDQKQIGFIAQQFEEVYPELVHTDSEGYKSVAYNKMTAILVEAVKELNEKLIEENEELKVWQEKLKLEILTLRSHLDFMDTRMSIENEEAKRILERLNIVEKRFAQLKD